MKFPPSLLDEIRARLPVSAVVGRRVKLTKAGREFKGLSPFNAEKSPSFFVNDQKGFYHDFSSGKHGDIFTFLMETEGLAFPEAVERLAAEAGVAMPARSEEAERIGIPVAGEFVRVKISDTGAGVLPEVLPRIFEPFFTTKPVGTGTGLGLSVSYGIIKSMNGTIEASSTGIGARFEITLPESAVVAGAVAR